MRESVRGLELIDVDFPGRVKSSDISYATLAGEDVTIGQSEKRRVLERATPLPPASLFERVYSAMKRAIISIIPEEYFFRKRYGV
jgi:hypothetical protein